MTNFWFRRDDYRTRVSVDWSTNYNNRRTDDNRRAHHYRRANDHWSTNNYWGYYSYWTISPHFTLKLNPQTLFRKVQKFNQCVSAEEECKDYLSTESCEAIKDSCDNEFVATKCMETCGKCATTATEAAETTAAPGK